MGAGCLNLTIRKQNSLKIGKLAERMTYYYVFQKKIENIFNFDKSLLNYYDSSFTFNNKDRLMKFYILDYDWIRNWKENSAYNSVKPCLDEIYSINNPNNIIDLETRCQNLENENVIINFETTFINTGVSYSLFISNNKYKLEDFDCLVDETTYKLFKEMSFWNYFKGTENTLEGIISSRMIILFIDNMQTVKILYLGKVEDKDDELIQLTANCLEYDENSGDFFIEQSLFKYEAFKNFLINKRDDELFDLFENDEAIGSQTEIELTIGQLKIKIKNENLFSKYQSSILVPKKIINFENISKFRKIGLENVGATCYMNATLQCFMNINSLTTYLLTQSIYEQIENSGDIMELSKAYCHLLEKVWLDETIINYYAPREFKEVISAKNPLFQGINANDSKDLINFLLEVMNFELSRLNKLGNTDYKNDNSWLDPSNMLATLEYFRVGFAKNNNSIISQNFFFIIQTNTICNGCNSLKYNFQTLFLLEFPLELVYNYSLEKNLPSMNKDGKKCVNILTCFEHYQLPSHFTGENQLYCNTCQGQRDANSVNYLFSLPPVLVIILNRGKGKSFDCDVDFPEFLNLQNYVVYKKSLCNYRLKGVISHLGESGMSGHFIAYCRNRIDDNWYLYNDATVTLCKNQQNDFMVGTAYILFYESMDNSNNILFDKDIDPNFISNTLNGLNNNLMIGSNNLNSNMNNNNCLANNNNINIMNNMNFNFNMNNNMVNNFNNNIININDLGNNMNGLNNNMNNRNMNNNINSSINNMNDNKNNNFIIYNNINLNKNNNFNNINSNNNLNDINNIMNEMNINRNDINNNMNNNIGQFPDNSNGNFNNNFNNINNISDNQNNYNNFNNNNNNFDRNLIINNNFDNNNNNNLNINNIKNINNFNNNNINNNIDNNIINNNNNNNNINSNNIININNFINHFDNNIINNNLDNNNNNNFDNNIINTNDFNNNFNNNFDNNIINNNNLDNNFNNSNINMNNLENNNMFNNNFNNHMNENFQ